MLDGVKSSLYDNFFGQEMNKQGESKDRVIMTIVVGILTALSFFLFFYLSNISTDMHLELLNISQELQEPNSKEKLEGVSFEFHDKMFYITSAQSFVALLLMPVFGWLLRNYFKQKSKQASQ